MSFLLDTSVVSEPTRPQPSEAVLDWIAAQPVGSLFISVITIGELRRGALLLAAGKKRKALLHWIEADIQTDFDGRIVPIDTAVMECWAQLQTASEQRGKRLPMMDSLLAASALAHGLTLVTRNTADFKSANVPLLDPWRGADGS